MRLASLSRVFALKKEEMDARTTDAQRGNSLHCRKFTPTPKFLGTVKAYFVCHISPIFQISLIYAFIECP